MVANFKTKIVPEVLTIPRMPLRVIGVDMPFMENSLFMVALLTIGKRAAISGEMFSIILKSMDIGPTQNDIVDMFYFEKQQPNSMIIVSVTGLKAKTTANIMYHHGETIARQASKYEDIRFCRNLSDRLNTIKGDAIFSVYQNDTSKTSFVFCQNIKASQVRKFTPFIAGIHGWPFSGQTVTKEEFNMIKALAGGETDVFYEEIKNMCQQIIGEGV